MLQCQFSNETSSFLQSIHCGGSLSCQHSRISVFKISESLVCAGLESCAYSHISSSNHVYGRGPLSLYGGYITRFVCFFLSLFFHFFFQCLCRIVIPYHLLHLFLFFFFVCTIFTVYIYKQWDSNKYHDEYTIMGLHGRIKFSD